MPGRIAKERLFEQPNKNFGVCQINGTPVFIEKSVVKVRLKSTIIKTYCVLLVKKQIMSTV